MSSHRLQKLNRLIREEIGKIIQKEIDFRKDVLVTITAVETSKDIKHAKVKISVLPEKETKEIVKKLEKKIFLIQKHLNQRLILRYVPKIRFVIDRGSRQATRIEELARRLEKQKR